MVVEETMTARIGARKDVLTATTKVHDEPSTLARAVPRAFVEQLDEVVVQPLQAVLTEWTTTVEDPRNPGGQDVLTEGAARLIHPVTVTTVGRQLRDHVHHAPNRHGTLGPEADAYTQAASRPRALTESCDAYRDQPAANRRARARYQPCRLRVVGDRCGGRPNRLPSRGRPSHEVARRTRSIAREAGRWESNRHSIPNVRPWQTEPRWR